ncbi:MAG: hypothetical protein GX162_07430 [Firmicutes bacterium]|jgi:hypothetical protein|nr:hypothetical protein [Bacillota bacterium]
MKKKRLIRDDGRYVLLYFPDDVRESKAKQTAPKKSEETISSSGEDEKSV